jgi:hypothetical protein
MSGSSSRLRELRNFEFKRQNTFDLEVNDFFLNDAAVSVRRLLSSFLAIHYRYAMMINGVWTTLWWAGIAFCSAEVAVASAPKFDWRLANVSVELSTIAYCDDPQAALSAYPESLRGFTISSLMIGTKGFIGSMPSERAIYVVYAGTGTLLDWVVDADANLMDYGGCDKCKVHQGFRIVEQMGFPKVLSSVGILKLMHPSYKVVVTGHSKGAAEATIAALDLVKAGISDVSLVNFGSPRVENAHFAEYASSKLKAHYRVTHHTDTVPSVPRRREGYQHISGEWYEHPALHVRPCVGYEDPTCSAQWGRHFGMEDGAPTPANETTATDPPAGADGGDGGEANTATPTPLNAPGSLEETYLTLLSAAGTAEYDHLHYLGRAMRCPSAPAPSPGPEQPSNSSSADSGSSNAAEDDATSDTDTSYIPYPFQPGLGHSQGAPENATQDGRREAARAQRRMMAFVLVASLCLMLLFALTIFYAIREGARRATAERRRREQSPEHVNRETELAPLLQADAAKESYNATTSVEDLA